MMTPMQCNREAEVVEVLSAGRWPDQTHPELREHVKACSLCTEVVTVALAMREHYDTAANSNIRIPSAGLVWWRSELRARREAVRTAERPLKLVHALAGACAVGVMFAVLSQMSPLFDRLFTSMIGYMPESPALLLQQHLPLTLGLGVLVVLAPVALYFVFSDK
jgi:hypothetical protein